MTVSIYHDPITRQHLEGKATIIKVLSKDLEHYKTEKGFEQMVHATVRFSDGFVGDRNFLSKTN